jgi:hypothetical protein
MTRVISAPKRYKQSIDLYWQLKFYNKCKAIMPTGVLSLDGLLKEIRDLSLQQYIYSQVLITGRPISGKSRYPDKNMFGY